MVSKLTSFALKQPLFTLMMAVLFIGGGVAAFKAVPIEAFPDVSDIQTTIITLYPGQAPEEVEKQVTIPLEIALSGLPHSVRMFSHTQFGLSFIIITFDDQATDLVARQQVLERIQSVTLPPGVQANLAPLSTPIGEIYRYRVKGEGWSPTDLRSVQDWQVTPYLRMTPGVSDIVSFGGMIKQYQANIDLAKMKFYNVSLQQVLTALSRSNANAGGSYLEKGSLQYIIRGIGILKSASDIENVVVTEKGGLPILLKDIAVVSTSNVPRQGIIGQDVDGDVVTGIALLRKGENPSDVLASLQERVNTLNSRILPNGVQVVPYYDRSSLIHRTLHTVFKNLIEGALLVFFILTVFLGSVRPALIVASVIPLALLSTFIGLHLRGIPANLLSLGAMDFGIIVDGAVIVVENIYRRLVEVQHHGGSKRLSLAQMAEVVMSATGEVGRPTFFSMLIIIIAHVPILALQRQEGRIFAPMAYTVNSALIGSLLISLTLVPLLCYFLLRKGLVEKENWIVATSKKVYRIVLENALAHPGRVLATAVIGLLLSGYTFFHLGTEFLPELNEGSIWVNIELDPGISLTEVRRIGDEVRRIIKQFPEVITVVSKAGRPEDGTDPKPLNMIECFVDLKPESEWTEKISKNELIQRMNLALMTIPGLKPSFSQPIRDNILESISQIDGQVVVKIFGDKMEELNEVAEAALKEVIGVQGVERAFIDRHGEIPQLQIEIDRAAASRFGLNVADVEDVIETALAGKVATEIWEGEKKFSVAVRLPDAARDSIESIRQVLVDTPQGMRVPLDQVAKIKTSYGNLNISREFGKRVRAIGVFIRGRDMGSVVADMRAKIEHMKMPGGFFVTWSGEFENQQRAMARLLLILPISIFLIFILLFDAFKSAKYATVILLNVPFALIGGVFGLFFTGFYLSVSAAIGFIALFGQSVLNGVVMISYFEQLKAQGRNVREAVVEGSIDRLRTVMMTALLAMFGLLPMALSREIGSEVQKPLAIVIIGGLVTATLLTLVVLPLVYYQLNKRQQVLENA